MGVKHLHDDAHARLCHRIQHPTPGLTRLAGVPSACLRIGFERLGLSNVVSYTTLSNAPSIAVMRRIGMVNANADFEHPALPAGHALKLHCLYKISRAQWASGAALKPKPGD
jgi:hypothetical protein